MEFVFCFLLSLLDLGDSCEETGEPPIAHFHFVKYSQMALHKVAPIYT